MLTYPQVVPHDNSDKYDIGDTFPHHISAKWTNEILLICLKHYFFSCPMYKGHLRNPWSLAVFP